MGGRDNERWLKDQEIVDPCGVGELLLWGVEEETGKMCWSESGMFKIEVKERL